MMRLLLVSILIGLLATITSAATKTAQKKVSDPNDNKGKIMYALLQTDSLRMH